MKRLSEVKPLEPERHLIHEGAVPPRQNGRPRNQTPSLILEIQKGIADTNAAK